MQIEKFSYASTIFNRTLETIDEHKASYVSTSHHPFRQSRNWWNCLPELAQQNLIDHSFMQEENPHIIHDFYWGD